MYTCGIESYLASSHHLIVRGSYDCPGFIVRDSYGYQGSMNQWKSNQRQLMSFQRPFSIDVKC